MIRTKQAVVKTVVGAVEQLYRELDGEGKLNQAISAANDMLAVKNIEITELELRMLIEAAVGEFNKNKKEYYKRVGKILLVYFFTKKYNKFC